MSGPAAGSEYATPASTPILDRLMGLHPKLIDLSLDRVYRLLDALGNPHRKLPPVIHVAGTNGKGSVIAFLKAMIEAGGYSVHQYTSPHLVRFHERIVLAGQPIADADLADVLAACEAANTGQDITFFEITTAAAFLAFSRQPADVLLLEVGLGGRLDATNVIDKPALTVITPIDYDHQDFLGDTLTSIAGEKAGILKRGVIGVIGPQADEARATIEARAIDVGAPLSLFGQEFMAFEEQGRLVYQDEKGLLDLPLPRLTGRHQIENAGTAIAALREMSGFDLSTEAMERGLTGAVWPARLQRLTRGPLVDRVRGAAGGGADHGELWLDGGHNPHGARAIGQTLADLDTRVPRALYLIVGMMGNKDARGFLEVFGGLVRHVICVPIAEEAGAADPDDLARAAQDRDLPASTAPDVRAAIDRILQMAREDGEPAPRILICGSLYLAGRVLADHG